MVRHPRDRALSQGVGTGHKSLVYVSRFPGHIHPTRRRIARVNGNTLIRDVRKLAWDWQDQIELGVDPVVSLRDAKAAREAERKRREAGKFGIVLERFLIEHAEKKIKGKETRRLLTTELPRPWYRKHIAEIQSSDCRAMIKTMVSRGTKARSMTAQAFNFFSCLRKLFNCCIHEELITTSPMVSLNAENVIGDSKTVRDRILTDDEIRAVWNAAGQMALLAPYCEQVGWIANDWAGLEFRIDHLIWYLAGVDRSAGACMTSQLTGIKARLCVLLALIKLRS
jgi:hypothetical protein